MDTPLNNFLIDDPRLYRMSMMFGRGAVDIVVRRLVGEPEMIVSRIEISPAASSPAQGIEEIIYSNPVILQPFKKVDIVFDGGFTLVAPIDADTEDIDKIFPLNERLTTLATPIDSRNKLVFRVDTNLLNFIRRTFDAVVPTHSLAILGRYFEHRARLGNSGKMYVNISKDAMDVLIFNQIGLAMASSYSCPDINDAAYYALAAAHTAGFDMASDEIRISGNSDRRAELMPVLRKFSRSVMPAIFPSADVNYSSVAMTAPFPLIVMPLCE